MIDEDILRKLIVIHIEGQETLSSEEQIEFDDLKKRFESPCDWQCMTSRTKPFFLTSMKQKLYHLECEGFLHSFLIRIIVVTESIKEQEPEVEVILKQLDLAAMIFDEGIQKEEIFKASSNTLKLVFFTLIAKIYEIRGYLKKSLKALRSCQHMPVDRGQRGILSGIRAIVSSYYGIEGLITAMEDCVSPTDSFAFEVERRFLLVIILPQVSDIDFTEVVVREVTAHMGYTFTTRENKPANTFSHFWRLTAQKRNVQAALVSLQEALAICESGIRKSPLDLRLLDMQVIWALETAPCNLDLIATAARYFFVRRQAHKSFWLCWVGRTNYRRCAENLFQTLSMLYPGSEAVDCDSLLQYFTPRYSLGVVKDASLYLLTIDPRRALRMARWALRIQVQLWNEQQVPLHQREDQAVMLCGQAPWFGFLEVMCCLADGRQGQQEAEEFSLEARATIPHIAAVLGNTDKVERVLRQLEAVLRQEGLPRLVPLPTE